MKCNLKYFSGPLSKVTYYVLKTYKRDVKKRTYWNDIIGDEENPSRADNERLLRFNGTKTRRRCGMGFLKTEH
jgi:hypothetical protein